MEGAMGIFSHLLGHNKWGVDSSNMANLVFSKFLPVVTKGVYMMHPWVVESKNLGGVNLLVVVTGVMVSDNRFFKCRLDLSWFLLEGQF